MIDLRRIRERLIACAGLLCLIATVVLSSGGVSAVRAEGEAALMSVDPVLEARLDGAAPPAPVPAAPPTPPTVAPGEEPRAGLPGVEVAPGVIVLNTRGYNYGPPVGEIDRAAMGREQPRR